MDVHLPLDSGSHGQEIECRRSGKSNVMRKFQERQLLQKHRGEIVTVRIRGYLFFGSAVRLRDAVLEMIRPHPDLQKGSSGSVDPLNHPLYPSSQASPPQGESLHQHQAQPHTTQSPNSYHQRSLRLHHRRSPNSGDRQWTDGEEETVDRQTSPCTRFLILDFLRVTG